MKLTDAEKRSVDELLAAIRAPVEENFSGGTFLSAAFADHFRATLMVHHYFLGAALGTSFFEAAFYRAAKAAGHKVAPAPDGCRFWDVEIDGIKVSLKSSSAAGMRANKLHVSKLCEAAWIQDMRGAAQREAAAKDLFAEYTDLVDSIVQLRYFRKSYLYQMVRLPSAILKQVADVPRAEFAPDGPTIGIPVGKAPPDFTLKLDRSDAKITLTNINVDVCEILASWQLDPPPESP